MTEFLRSVGMVGTGGWGLSLPRCCWFAHSVPVYLQSFGMTGTGGRGCTLLRYWLFARSVPVHASFSRALHSYTRRIRIHGRTLFR